MREEKREPLVSVIVPVYNVEKYLKRCLDSIIEQTYKNIEIILVDDGSTDRSGEICDEYKKRDERIVLVRQKNKGVASARNSGLKKAKGELICFIDPDDFVKKEYVDILTKTIKMNNGDIAICGYCLVDEDGNDFRKKKKYTGQLSTYSQEEAMKELFYQKAIDNSLCWRIFKKEVLKGIVFPDGMIFEDYAVMYGILKNASQVLKIDTLLYYYTQRDGSIMHLPFSERNFDILKVSKLLYNQISLEKPGLKKAVTSRFISACFYLLRVVDRKKYSAQYDEIVENIRKYRRVVLFDNNAKKKIKVGILLSYISESLIPLVYNCSFIKRKVYMR